MNYSQARLLFYWALILSLPLKLVLAQTIPLTGDEAYFVVWGDNLAWGYYDHPPLIGWLIHLCLKLHDSQLFARLPSILTAYILVWGVYSILKDQDRTRALLAASILLLTPVYLIGIIVTTDIPLILTMFLSVLTIYHAEQRNKIFLFVLAGFFLGLAFLSKYFAMLLLLTYLAYFLPVNRKNIRHLALILMGFIPFVIFHLYWNYTHCWTNIMFNFINRAQDPQINLLGPVGLIGAVIWILSPMIVFHMFKYRSEITLGAKNNNFMIFVFAGFLPLTVFLCASLFYSIGLHWIFGFLPFLYLLHAQIPYKSMSFCYKSMAGYAAIHIIVIITILLLPLNVLKDREELYREAVFYLRPAEVAQALTPFNADHYTTSAYGRSAILSFYSKHYWGVLGSGSKYGREDDRITDFRKLDNKNILFFSIENKLDMKHLGLFFQSVETNHIQVNDAKFTIALGYKFDYKKYRQNVLTEIRKNYYDIPNFLPHSGCFFTKRYF